MYFRGRSLRNLDPKGRMTLPPEFRETLLDRSPGGRMMLTTYDRCIVGFPLPDWELFEDGMHRIKGGSETLRDFRRLVIGGARDVSVDAQGRILLSRDHLQYSNIGGEAVLMGQGPRFEIWEPARLETAMHRDFTGVAAEMAETGIDFVF
jgi:MraZ protein